MFPQILILIIVVLVLIASRLLQSRYYSQIGTMQARLAVPYERVVADAQYRILVVGDSTAVGVGTSGPEHSIPGLVAQKYPSASVVNIAVNGSMVADVCTQLEQTTGRYDLILMQVGGNDIIRFTRYRKYTRDIRIALTLAKNKARYVLLVPVGNAGSCRIFRYPLRWWMEWRTHGIRKCTLAVVRSAGPTVRYVDLFDERAKDPFMLDPQQYFSEDQFHPNDAGYAQWMTKINRELEHFDLG
ncbi:SGNH/GDSL hydrolase family protein [Candidatus Gracilibacteria bacterium]|nr:SGNH/GDSL hydrolase family protein [Candidatus Gracilibacteria bacterium]